MVSAYLLSEIKKRFTGTFVISKTIKTIGIAESVLEEKIVDVIKGLPENTKIAFLPGFCGVDLRITGKFKDESEGLQITYNIEESINHLLGKNIYGTDDDTMERVVARLLMERNKTLSVAGSCTGGLVCHLLTEISGSSNYFDRGIVTYSNESKWEILGIPPHIIEEHGAVSPETAVMMANNVRKIGKTNIGLSITGIAGPTGGTKEKPVGLVYIGLSVDETENIWKKFLFSGDRSTIKLRSAYNALNIVREYLI
jgi:nicotinamide-nucleotide amidase